MKTLKEVVENHPAYEKLIRAVHRSIGADSIDDVNAHGIDGGFSGFIYHRETTAFYFKHKDAILKMAGEMAEGIGEAGLISMVQKFRCLDGQYSQEEIGRALFNFKVPDDNTASTIRNAMAWFAAEEVCRMFED